MGVSERAAWAGRFATGRCEGEGRINHWWTSFLCGLRGIGRYRSTGRWPWIAASREGRHGQHGNFGPDTSTATVKNGFYTAPLRWTARQAEQGPRARYIPTGYVQSSSPRTHGLLTRSQVSQPRRQTKSFGFSSKHKSLGYCRRKSSSGQTANLSKYDATNCSLHSPRT